MASLSDRIEAAFVFGSVARGEETPGSDVDVMIIGPVDFGAVLDALYPAQQQLGRDINPKVFSRQEWAEKLDAGSAFIADVMDRQKIFLKGTEDR